MRARDGIFVPRRILARGGACVSGRTARRLSAVGGQARRLRHLVSDRRARLHRGGRQARAGDRRCPRRRRARRLVRAPVRPHRRRHPARRAGHRLFPCRGRGPRRLPALPLQSRPGAGRRRLCRQHHSPGPARRAAEFRGTRHRGGDRRGLGSAARPDPGDRRAGLGQVHPARRRHAAAAGARRRAHPVLRGADRIRIRPYRRRRRADVVFGDPPPLPKLSPTACALLSAAARPR